MVGGCLFAPLIIIIFFSSYRKYFFVKRPPKVKKKRRNCVSNDILIIVSPAPWKKQLEDKKEMCLLRQKTGNCGGKHILTNNCATNDISFSKYFWVWGFSIKSVELGLL